ncbi:MAG: POTRA domain-containing protein [Terriglobia bacterium]
MRALVFAMLGASAYGGQAARGAGLWGKTLLKIEFHTDAQMSAAEFQGEITQKTGEPLEPQKVAQSLKNLYATGRFQKLRAEAEPAGSGVNLIFAGKATFFVGVVSVEEAPKAVSPVALISRARLTLGGPLDPAELESARKRITSFLAAEGYYEARVRYQIKPNPATQAAQVIFNVVPGRPAVLSRVEYQGHLPAPAARLSAVAGWKKASHLTSAKVQRGLYRIHKLLVDRNYLEATVSSERRVFNAAPNTETLIVKVNPGPLVRVRVEGARISTSQLKRTLPIFTDGLTDDLSLDVGSQALDNYFEQKGYFSARVRWRRISHPEETNITYIVSLGTESNFGGYDFQGNRAIPSSELAPLVTIQPASFPSHLRGIFSHHMLNHDVKAITTFYQSRGYLDAHVTPVLENKQGDLFVTFRIHEGPMTRVGKVEIRGVNASTESQLRTRLHALPGQPYSPALVAKDRESMLTFFANQGFSNAAVLTHVSSAGKYKMDVEYQVQPGTQTWVRNIVVLGNDFTREGVIRHQITLQGGEPLDEAELLQSQRNLYNLGLFNSVQIAPENPGSSETQKTMLVRVEQAQRWTLGYGFGLDVQRLGGGQPQGTLGASPRLSLDVTRINVGGRNQTFSLRGRLSDLETGGEASYLIPDFLNRPSLTLHLDAIADSTRDVLTFTSFIRQASLSIQKQFTASAFWVNRYNFRLVSVSDLKINELEIPLFSQPVRDAGFESTFIRDTRDDPTDATRGSYSLVDGSISAAQLGSEANFARLYGQYSTYYRLNSHLIFARNTELGVESPYGPLRVTPFPGETRGEAGADVIPLAERFFAGGADSLRSFSLNQAGPRDSVTGYPIGGQALFLNSLELRIPVRNGRYGLVFFNDAGNVYSSPSEMRLLKFDQTSPADLNYTVQAAGIGLRYRTPIGPVRLDLSYVFNPPRYEFRPATNLPLEVQQLPRFQYFISIGQSF